MGIKGDFTEKYFCKMFSRLLGKKGKKKQTLQELTAFMNPGRQRLRELKSIKEAALQRTLTNLQKNVERRSQKLPPISEVYSPSKSDKRSMTAMVKTDLSGVKLDNQEEIRSMKVAEPEQQMSKKGDVVDAGEKSDKDTGDKVEQKENETEEKDEGDKEKILPVPSDSKPKSVFDDAPVTRRKTAKEKRLEREAQEKAEKEAKEREERERLRAKWPTIKNAKKKKGAVASGRLDGERWHNFLREQFKVLKKKPNVSNWPNH